MLSILKEKKFIINLSLVMLLILIIIWGTLKSLEKFTRHGQAISVPDLTGQFLNEIEGNTEYQNFTFTIADSVYDLSKEKGTILSQDPKPSALVKEGRVIYLTIVGRNPKQVIMPELKDLSLRSASSVLETYGLKVGNISYIPDIATNAVLLQKYRGEIVPAGQLVRIGTVIDLVLGLGEQKGLVPVPVLIGLTHSEAFVLLQQSALVVGLEHFDEGDDTTSVRIYRQSPIYSKNSSAIYGSKVELWYKSDKNFNFDEYLEKIALDTL